MKIKENNIKNKKKKILKFVLKNNKFDKYDNNNVKDIEIIIGLLKLIFICLIIQLYTPIKFAKTRYDTINNKYNPKRLVLILN